MRVTNTQIKALLYVSVGLPDASIAHREKVGVQAIRNRFYNLYCNSGALSRNTLVYQGFRLKLLRAEEWHRTWIEIHHMPYTKPGEPEEKELEALWLMIQGHTHQSAAHKLGISRATFGRRLTDLFSRFDVNNCETAVAVACIYGFL